MIYIKQANTETFTTDPIKNCDGTPMDFSTATVKFIIKERMEDDDSLATIEKELEHPDSNILSWELDVEETKGINVGNYYVAVKIFWDDTREREIFNDVLTVEKGVFNE
jgi:hypothetical protein